MAQETSEEIILDARGSFCPGPLMETIKKIKNLKVGQILVVLSSDEGSTKDIPAWAEKAGHKVLEVKKVEDYWEIKIQKMR